MREFVPAQYRYTTVQQAAERITNEIQSWTPHKAQEVKDIAEQFSIRNFSKRFMSLFDDQYGKRLR